MLGVCSSVGRILGLIGTTTMRGSNFVFSKMSYSNPFASILITANSFGIPCSSITVSTSFELVFTTVMRNSFSISAMSVSGSNSVSRYRTCISWFFIRLNVFGIAIPSGAPISTHLWFLLRHPRRPRISSTMPSASENSPPLNFTKGPFTNSASILTVSLVSVVIIIIRKEFS
ncbi:hypothetical protein PBCV1_a299R [Paramecium bursaria Chlorella virus 1]|uniref:Uncharacterized protein n=1 Tax=Paramecium bursaria Chlorella virus 1 TaxID=10506 RepID=Q84615_PBCV1|nr:hypothetical protein PBCV1_a299R [Paramecium bursaria Chlorella virus 1]AAC96667.1 hypothetical protein [Paramecium bursaria Chlorella virus 1]